MEIDFNQIEETCIMNFRGGEDLVFFAVIPQQ